MANKRYFYIIGPDPYECNQSNNTKGNGKWSAWAENLKSALTAIFSAMEFPGEAVGRSRRDFYPGFIPGVSLAKHSEEVIQVWSDEPAAIEHMGSQKCPHEGTGRELGLLTELDVTKLDEYLTPITALLEDKTSGSAGLSPLGASIIDFQAKKSEIQREIQHTKFEVQKRQWELEEISDGMKGKIGEMQAKISLANTYLRGWSDRSYLCKGKRATGPYHVFQKRVYLAEEVAILGNFQRFDIDSLTALEQWLIESGRIWKLLPMPRTILVTQVRAEGLNYGDPFVNAFYESLNRKNIIWIRDGENVVHIDVENHFDNAVFPNRDEFDRIFKWVREHVWESRFKPSDEPEHHWFRDRQQPPIPGTIMPVEKVVTDLKNADVIWHRPENEEEPYVPVKLACNRYTALQDWLDSEDYTPEIDTQLRQTVQDYLRKRNMESMKFAVMLQGIVDQTDLLQIPKGTDLFDWENVATYLTLVYDYTHGLPDKTYSAEIDPYFTPGVCNVGDWVIAWVSDHPGHGSDPNPWLLQITGKTESGWPVVKYHRKTERNRWTPDEGPLAGRCKEAIKISLENKTVIDPRYERWSDRPNKWFPCVKSFVKVPLPPTLVEHILDDREWKTRHHTHVPLLAQYRSVLKQYLVNPKNMTRITLAKPNSDHE